MPKIIKHVYRICFHPIFEEAEVPVTHLDEIPYECVGVIASSLESAIEKVKQNYVGQELDGWIDDSEQEEWKGKSSRIVDDVIILSGEYVSSIDVD